MHGLCGAQNFPLRCLKFTWHCQLWPWGILDIKFSTCSSWLILVNASWWGKQASNTLEKSFIHLRSTASLLHLGIFHENKTYLVYTISYFAKPLRCWDSHPLSDLYVRMPVRSMINLMIFDDQLDDLWCHPTQRSTGIFGCFSPGFQMIPAAPAHPSTPSLHSHPTPVRPRQSHGWSRYRCRWPLQRRCQQPAESAASKHSRKVCV